MRTLAVGDIHGCYHALKTLEAFAEFQPEDHIITLGDHIHRGPDSRSVIEWLLERRGNGRLTALRGNHECMFQAAITSELDRETWLGFGGDQMLASYQAQSINQIPTEHREFLQSGLQDFYENGTHVCVHANAREDLALKDQPEKWVKELGPLNHQPQACTVLRAIPANIDDGLEILRKSMPTKTLGFLCHLARMNEAPSWLSEEELKAWEEASLTTNSLMNDATL